MNTFKFCLVGCCLAATACFAPVVVRADTYTIYDYSYGTNPDGANPDGSYSYYGGGVVYNNVPYPGYAFDVAGDDSKYGVDTMTITRGSNSFSAQLQGAYFSSNVSESVGSLFLTNTGWNPYSAGPGDVNYSAATAGNSSTVWNYALAISGATVSPNGGAATGKIALYSTDGGSIVKVSPTTHAGDIYRADQDFQYIPGTGQQALAMGTWALDPATGTFTFSLDGIDLAVLNLNGEIGLQWTMSCGNDIVAGVMPANGATVPEPATILLFGFGLSGLAAYRRRKK